jgi:t-SNARE complex subunit (syntaxin)
MESDTNKSQRTSFETQSSVAEPSGNSNGITRQNIVKSSNGYDPLAAHKSALEEENNRFIGDQNLKQKQMIRHQDGNLTKLEKGVEQLEKIATGIHQELKEQDKLLDNLKEEVDDSASRLDAVTNALGKLLRTKDSCQIWTLVSLVIVMVIMSKFIHIC